MAALEFPELPLHSPRFGKTPASTRAKRGAQFGLEGRHYPCRVIRDLRLGQGGLAALESDPDHQRILAGGKLFTVKQVGGFYGSQFRNAETADGVAYLRKPDAIAQQQRKIALDRRKAWQRLVTAG